MDAASSFGVLAVIFVLAVGFEYVTGEYNDGGKIFRKRK